MILGRVGDNFGAGMTGGMAFIYDPQRRFDKMANPESLVWRPVVTAHWEQALKSI